MRECWQAVVFKIYFTGLFGILLALFTPSEAHSLSLSSQEELSPPRQDGGSPSGIHEVVTREVLHGERLIEQGLLDKAVHLALLLITAAPQDYRVHEFFGDTQVTLGKIIRAQEAYHKALDIAPDEERLRQKWVQVREYIGAVGEPEPRVQKPTIESSSSEDPARAMGTSPWKEILADLREGQVVGLRERILDLMAEPTYTEPDSGAVKDLLKESLALGTTLLQEGRAEDAMELTSAVLWLDPTNVEVNHLLGTAAAEAGQEEEAMFALQRALHMSPENSGLLEELKTSRRRLGLSGLGVGMEAFETPTAQEDEKPGHHIRGYTLISYGWDSNLSLSTDSSVPHPSVIGTTIEPDVDRDVSADLLISMEHDYSCAPEGWRWLNRFRFFLSDYRHHEDQDFLLFRPSTGMTYRSPMDTVGFQVFWEPLYLEGRLYRNQLGLEMFVTHATAGNSFYSFIYRYTNRHHFATRGSSLSSHHGRGHFLMGSWNYYCENGNWWESRLSYAYSKSPVDLRDPSIYHRLQGQAYYHYALAERVEVYAGLLLWTDRYDNYHSTFVDRRQRNYALAGEIGAFLGINDYLAFLLTFYQGYNDSNVPTSQYKQGKYSLSLQCAF